MTTKRGTNAERLKWLREWGGLNDHISYVVNHRRLESLHPTDRMFFEEDVREILGIAFERGISAGREYALKEFDFLTAESPSGFAQ